MAPFDVELEVDGDGEGSTVECDKCHAETELTGAILASGKELTCRCGAQLLTREQLNELAAGVRGLGEWQDIGVLPGETRLSGRPGQSCPAKGEDFKGENNIPSKIPT